MGGKPSRTWSQAKVRWIKEKQHKRSLYDDTLHFDWLQNYLGHYPLTEITKDVVESLAVKMEEKGRQAASVNRRLALVRAVLNRAKDNWEWLDKVPKFQMRYVPKVKVRWLTKEEVKELLKELPTHLKAMAKFSLATGLRQSNVVQLKWSYVDLKRKHAFIDAAQTKNNKPLSVPLNPDAIEVLQEQIGKHPEYVFVYKQKPVTQCNTKAWRAALKRAKIKNFRWHDLRHTWASWHVQSGTSLQELQLLGGWSSFEMVLRYAHLSSTHLQVAANRISGAEMVQPQLRIVGENG